MRTTIRSKNLDITSAFAEYIEKKLVSHIKKFIKQDVDDDLPVLDIEFGRSTRHHHKGEVFFGSAQLTLGALVFRAESNAEDVHAACDELRKELEREIKRSKERNTAVKRRAARILKEKTNTDPAAGV